MRVLAIIVVMATLASCAPLPVSVVEFNGGGRNDRRLDLESVNDDASLDVILTLNSTENRRHAVIMAFDQSTKQTWVVASDNIYVVSAQGKVVQTVKAPSAGHLASIFVDSEQKATFGLLEGANSTVSVVKFGGSGWAVVGTVPDQGYVEHSSYGLFEAHYAFIIQPINRDDPRLLFFFDTKAGNVHKRSPLDIGGRSVMSMGIDYLHNNVYMLLNSAGKSLDFSIVHMNGTLQEVLSSTEAYTFASRSAAVVITEMAYYAVCEQKGNGAPYLLKFALVNGAITINGGFRPPLAMAAVDVVPPSPVA